MPETCMYWCGRQKVEVLHLFYAFNLLMHWIFAALNFSEFSYEMILPISSFVFSFFLFFEDRYCSWVTFSISLQYGGHNVHSGDGSNKDSHVWLQLGLTDYRSLSLSQISCLFVVVMQWIYKCYKWKEKKNNLLNLMCYKLVACCNTH